jgi:hypothetical protein
LLWDALSMHFPGAISSLRELFLPLSVDFGIEHPPVNAGHTRIDNANGLCGALFLFLVGDRLACFSKKNHADLDEGEESRSLSTEPQSG